MMPPPRKRPRISPKRFLSIFRIVVAESALRLMFSVLALSILTGINGVEHNIRSEDLSE